MATVRKINKVLKSKPTREGAGVRLQRVFGFQHVPQLDPFLLLDEFGSDDPQEYEAGFPWHPHRGIETITYVLRGTVAHGDSLGNEGLITSGDVQWMTAGSGIVHQEMPQGDEQGMMRGFQLWANLPASHKMMAPRYRDVKAKEIPEVALEDGVRAKIVCGQVNGVRGPVQDVVTDPEYLDVTVPPATRFSYGVEKGYTVFAYVVAGQGYFEPERDPYGYELEGVNYFDFKRDCLMRPGNLILYADGDELAITSDDEDQREALRFLLVSGKPIGEPIAWHGPIVMNTREELRVAFEEYQSGTFLKQSQ